MIKEITMSESVRKLQRPETLKALGFIIKDEPKQSEVQPKEKQNKMTKTEQKFMDDVLRPREQEGAITNVMFHGLAVYLQNGRRYTPDFNYICDGQLHVVEVKGSYRLHSYRDAIYAFKQAKIEWPCFTWLWFELNKDGSWAIKK